ncbi:uncharacterized protein LOC142541588 [Primulina tabacum]|uniref:uncharacterized protein LOC142541588 n=1 Tax=Primulina tabacum TaxID=48773 RepID=UPI003F593F95
MASPLHIHTNCDPVFFRSLYSETPMRSGSKSQMYLHKILHIITTVPPLTATTSSPEMKESSADKFEIIDENKGYVLDLNVGVSISALEMEESLSGLSSCSATIGVSFGLAVIDGGAFKVNSKNYRDEEAEKSLTLLIVAAKLVFGEVEEDNTKKEEVAAAEPGERRLLTEERSVGGGSSVVHSGANEAREDSGSAAQVPRLGAGAIDPVFKTGRYINRMNHGQR